MRTSQVLVGLVGLGLVGIGAATPAHAGTISANFYGLNNWWANPAPTAYQTLASGDSAGAYAATGWQNIPVDTSANVALTLTDASGNSAASLYIPSGIIGARNGLTFCSAVPVASDWNGGAPTSEATQNQLYAGGIGLAGGYTAELQLSGITYANYDVYVYIGTQAGYSASAQLFTGNSTTASQSYYMTSGGWDYGNPSPNSYVLATSTDSTNPTTGGNYVVFSGLSGDSQTIDVTGPNAPGIVVAGLQIVSVPEPTTLALLGAPVLLLMRRRRA